VARAVDKFYNDFNVFQLLLSSHLARQGFPHIDIARYFGCRPANVTWSCVIVGSHMSGCSYVERRGSRYYFRVRVPLDVVAIAGRTHVVAALGTADARVAKIKSARLFLLLAAFLETMRLKMARMLDFDGNGSGQLEMLAAGAFALGQEYKAQSENLRQEFLVRLSQLIASVRDDAHPSPLAAPFVGNMDGVISLAAVRERIAAPAGPAFAMPQPLPAVAPTSPPWTDLKLAFLADKPGLTKKTLWSYNQAFDIWKSLIGDKAIAEIRRADMKLFADHLRDKPNARGGCLNHKSIERSLGHIKNFMAWAVEAGHGEDDRFGDVKGRDKTREERLAGNSRRAFTAVELERLFDSSLFRKPKDEAEQATAWFLAIAALTGARTDEIAEAPAELVKLGDVWCLDLRQAGTKMRAAPRLVPLLPDLIRLGLPAWAKQQAALGRRLVRPGAEPRTTAAWSKYLNRFINEHVVDTPDLVLYSLRHSFRPNFTVFWLKGQKCG
jgi:integrase